MVFRETVEGITLTFTAIDNLVGGPRFIGVAEGNSPINGLQLGGGGGSTLEFTLRTDKGVRLNSYSTDTGGSFLNEPTFNVVGGGVLSNGNSLDEGNPAHLFVGGPLVLDAGQTVTFSINGPSAVVQAFVASLDVTPVPLPGAVWMLGGAVLGLAALRRRR